MVKPEMRLARRKDVEAIRKLLGDDGLGSTREDMSKAGLAKYYKAFEQIESDPNNQLWVAVVDGQVVGTWQVTYITYLSRGGSTRCLIEAVRTRADLRGRGVGKEMMLFALSQARKRGCALAQLTTDKTRQDAHRFYARLGFEASHEGMKIALL